MTKKTLFLNGWYFTKQPLGSTLEDIKERKEAFRAVNLPHDWLIYQGKELYEDSTGWYRKVFSCEKQQDYRYEIYFEGVYMDTTVYLNGQVLGEWKYGYSSFFFDMTPLLQEGDNELLVRVNYQAPNSRWYSGAGIYRNVYLRKQPKCHFITDSLYITPVKKSEDMWQVEVSAELSQESLNQENSILMVQILDREGTEVSKAELPFEKAVNQADGIVTAQIMTQVSNPELWNLEEPYLYHCRLVLLSLIHISEPTRP